MLLEITVVAGSGTHPIGPTRPTELSIVWPESADTSGRSLAEALSKRWAGCCFSVAGEPLTTLQAGTAPLVCGAIVVAWPKDSPLSITMAETNSSDPPNVAVVVVTSGPSAGAVFELHRGRYTIGRGDCHIQLADPALSRDHGILSVGPEGMTLTPVSGALSIYRPGTESHDISRGIPPASAIPVKGVTAIAVGHVILCGASTLTLRFHESLVDVTPLSLLDPSALDPLEVPNLAGTARHRGALLFAAFIPLLMGVGLALMTGSWMFLSFAAMGALTVFVPLLGGSARRKRMRAAIAHAVCQDRTRLAQAFPDAGSLILASCARELTHPPQPTGLNVALRLGTFHAPAGIVLTPPDPSFTPPLLPLQPCCLRLGATAATLNGPEGPVLGLLNFVLMQLDAAGVPVVLQGPADKLPLAARLLPRTTLAASTFAALHTLNSLHEESDGDGDSLVAVYIQLGLSTNVPAPMPPGVSVMHFSFLARAEDRPAAAISLHMSGNRAWGTINGHDFTPDGVPDHVFAAHARRRALEQGRIQQAHPRTRRGAPYSLAPHSLPEAEHSTMAALHKQWAQSEGKALSPIPIGRTGSGTQFFDFQSDGPHLLLGGTTGSGKSELLRTMIGNLAVLHSPTELQFVLIDFKGGTGLGTLCELPHTSSLITDLGGHAMDRALLSLRAELHRREAVLATAQAADCDEYRAKRSANAAGTENLGTPLTHLVIVIDEFRVLVDQHPDTMAELMRIAAVGRSLGIHLVMATQRPQGALNADIRANVTSSICLRVQTVFDSIDVIGTGAAASIAVNTPGRAYLSRAGGPPEEFQSATLRLPKERSSSLPRIELTITRLMRDSLPSSDQGSFAPQTLQNEVSALTAALQQAWQTMTRADAAVPPRASSTEKLAAAATVIAPELPDTVDLYSVENTRTPAIMSDGDAVFLGLLDVPQAQTIGALVWSPASQSHLGCFGTTAETSRALALVAGQLLVNSARQDDASQKSAALYLLDGNNSMGGYATHPWVGAHLSPRQLRTTTHLIQRLAQSAAQDPRQHILCISDWGRWVSVLRSSPWHSTEEQISELIRFSPSNLAVVIGGGRELLSAAFLPAIPNRMYLPHGSSSESTLLWPRLPRFTSRPGRAAVAGPIDNSGHSGPEISVSSHSEAVHIAQLALPEPLSREQAGQGRGRKTTMRILQVQDLPIKLSVAELLRPAANVGTGDGTTGQEILLGIGGDGNDPVKLFLGPGSVLPVIGGPQSGKTSFVHAMGQIHMARRIPPHQLLWLDDVQSLTGQQLQEVEVHRAAGGTVVAVFTHPGLTLSKLPPEWGLRTAQRGIVLMPQRASDGDFFGTRLDTAGAEPPGRAVLLDHGQRQWFQFPQAEEQL